MSEQQTPPQPPPRTITIGYTPPVPATDAIANLHDEFHARGHLIARARRLGDTATEAALEIANAATAAAIATLNAEVPTK